MSCIVTRRGSRTGMSGRQPMRQSTELRLSCNSPMITSPTMRPPTEPRRNPSGAHPRLVQDVEPQRRRRQERRSDVTDTGQN
jgi:hypothetical protein